MMLSLLFANVAFSSRLDEFLRHMKEQRYDNQLAAPLERPARAAPSNDYVTASGSGKCLTSDGQDPSHNYHHGVGESACKEKCDEDKHCFGYSVSSYGNCLNWLEAGLQGGGAAWGGADCHVKPVLEPGFATAPTAGKCVTSDGEDPNYAYFHGIGENQCISECEASDDCYGYSVSSYGNCLNWKEPGLQGGGAAWGDAGCSIKQSFTYAMESASGKCVSADGGDPIHNYFHAIGAANCKKKCDLDIMCFGYSVSSYGNCLNWLEPGLQGGGAGWGGAGCQIKQMPGSAPITPMPTPEPTSEPTPEPTLAPVLTSPSDSYVTASSSGKCLTNDGEDPNHSYFHGIGAAACQLKCDEDKHCFGFSVSSYGNCLNWKESGLKGGGEAWGGAGCQIKPVLLPAYATQSGTGKCVTANGEDPTYSYHHNVGASACKAECDYNDDCFGYSVSSYGNCLNWLEPGLQGGGAAWGQATCILKQPFAYQDASGTGKCLTDDGQDPAHNYYHDVGADVCKAKCDADLSCFGYSVSIHDNCLNWLQAGLQGGGNSWGGATCSVKQSSGNAIQARSVDDSELDDKEAELLEALIDILEEF